MVGKGSANYQHLRGGSFILVKISCIVGLNPKIFQVSFSTKDLSLVVAVLRTLRCFILHLHFFKLGRYLVHSGFLLSWFPGFFRLLKHVQLERAAAEEVVVLLLAPPKAEPVLRAPGDGGKDVDEVVMRVVQIKVIVV